MSQPQPLKLVAEAQPDKPPAVIMMLSVRVRGCTLACPILRGQSVDEAVRAVLARFNFNPDEFRGWKRVPGSPNTISVVVS
jgi:hypothetical protein